MPAIHYKNLDACEAFRALQSSTENRPPALDPERVEGCEIAAGGGLRYNYAAKPIDDEILERLRKLAEEQQLIEKYTALASGDVANVSEKRRVLHHLLRGEITGPVVVGGVDTGAFYARQKSRVYDFANRVRNGYVRGSTGLPFRNVVQIGIGGSDLGPRALYLALYNAVPRRMRAHFISNVDPDDAAGIISELNLEETLFVLVSKGGTTQETLANRDFVVEAMRSSNVRGLDPSRHMVAVTSQTSPLASSDEFLEAFYIDDYIGGRYSATSAVGGVVLATALGPDVFDEILAGAHESDLLALNADVKTNASMCDALIGVYERNVRNLPTTAILPYSQALHRFPAHLQQLDMESNGKSVNRFGEAVAYPTGPVVFGEPGTNGQHSFYQLLHQGTDIVPLQFIGFRSSQIGVNVESAGTTSGTKLAANLAAQIVAFAKGSPNDDPNKRFNGGRPSSLLYAEKLTPRVAGSLLAHFENKVMFQGFTWNVNSFDQEGVQLGKRLANVLLSGSSEDPALSAYARLLGLGE